MSTESTLIKTITITNPLEIGKGEESWSVWEPGAKLIDYIPEGVECIVAVSGGVVKPEQWEEYILEADDTIVISPVLRGGEGSSGKNILRIVAFIVLAYFTAGLSTALTATYGTVVATTIAAGVYIAGAMLINALLPATQKMPNADMSESASYGIQGPQNTSLEGIPVPVVYGTHVMAGNVMGVYVDSYGKSQTLNMLINAGEGPVKNITDIRLNDQEITGFRNAVVKVGFGTNEQDPPDFFGDTFIPQTSTGSVNVPTWAVVNPFAAPNPELFIERMTTQEVDGFRLDFIAPLGLMETDRKGNQRQLSVELRIMYQRVDAAGNSIGEPWKTELLQGMNVGVDQQFNYFDNANVNPINRPPGGGGGVMPNQPETPMQIKSAAAPVNGSAAAATPDTPFETEEGQVAFTPDTTINSTDPQNLGDGHSIEHDVTAFTSAVPTTPGLFYPSKSTVEDSLRPGTTAQPNGEIIHNATGKTVGQIIAKAQQQQGSTTGAAGFTGNRHYFSAKSRMPVRLTLKTPDDLQQGYYKIRIGRADVPKFETDQNFADLVQLENVYEIISDDVSYKNTAWVALRIQMNDQLQGLPNVTFTSHGVIIKVWDDAQKTWTWEASSNPAWVVMDMLTNTRYGAGIPLEQIDTETFREWARYCDAQTYPLEFNGIFDQSMNVWDAMKLVCRNGHASLIRVGSRFSVAIERADVPVMLFSEQNIVKDSFKQSWLGLTERANSINVAYFDRNYNWERKEVRIVSPLVVPGSEEITTELTLYGVTSRERAIADAWLQLNLNNWVNRTVEFEASLDAIACSVGSLIAVKHVGVNYFISGRAAKDHPVGTPNARIYVDQAFKFKPGFSYKVMWHVPAYGAGIPPENGAQITSVSAKDRVLTVSGLQDGLLATTWTSMDNQRPDVRKISHIECYSGLGQQNPVRVYKIERVEASNGRLKVAESIEDAQAGWYFRPVYGDLLVERPISSFGVDVDGNVEWVQITGNFPVTPKQFDHFMIGVVQNETRKYRVMSITGNGSEYTRTISAIEYHDEIYDFNGFVMPPDPDGSAPTGPGDGNYVTSGISHVRPPEDNQPWVIRERWQIGPDEASIRYLQVFSWRRPIRGSYAGADVFMRMLHPKEVGWAITNNLQFTDIIENNPWVHVATVRGVDELSYIHTFTSAERGGMVQFRVQAFDNDNRRPPFSTAPYVRSNESGEPVLSIIGIAKSGTSETQVENLQATAGYRQVRLSWSVPELKRDMYRGAVVYASMPGTILDPDAGTYNPPSLDSGTAVPIARVTFREEYTHFVSDNAPRAYWIRPVDLANDLGGFVGGVIESAVTTAGQILGGDFGSLDTYIQNIINNAPNIVRYEDYSDLNARVLNLLSDYIEQAQDIARIDTSSSDFFGRVQTLETQINGENGEPSVAQRLTTLAAQYDTNAAAIVVEQQARADADLAISNQLTVLTAEVDGNTAGLAEEIQTRATQDAALASSVSILGARVDTNESAILTEQQTRSTQDDALAAQITSVTSRVSTAEAAIQTEAATRSSALAAEAAAREAVSAQVALKNRVFRQAATPPSTGLVAGDLWYKTDQNNQLHVWTGSAWQESSDARIAMAQAAVAAESQARADQNSALATQISQVNAQITDPTTGLSATANRVQAVENSVTAVEGTLNSQSSVLTLLTNEVQAKNRTFAQDEPPTGTAGNPIRSGDLWIDTNDSNKLYRFNGATWNEVTLPRGNRTTVAAAAPTDPAPEIGDLWYDNSQAGGVVAYRYGGPGPGWVLMRDRELTARALDLEQVQTQISDQETGLAALYSALTVQGTRIGQKVQTYIAATAPVAGSEPFATGDLWINTSAGNRLHRWSGTAWVAVPNRESNQTFITTGAAPAAPADRGFVDGDLWFQLQAGTGYVQYRRQSGNWLPVIDETARAAAERITSVESFVDYYEAAIDDIDQLRASLLSASGQTIAATVTNLRSINLEASGSATARASLEVDVNGRIAGYRINNNGSTGNFDVLADNFRILSASGNSIYNFSTLGGMGFANFESSLRTSGRFECGSFSGTVIDGATMFGTSAFLGPFPLTYWTVTQNGFGWGSAGAGSGTSYYLGFTSNQAAITGSATAGQVGIIVTSGNVGTYAAPPSDVRLKTDFQDITNALEIVKSINVYTHEWDHKACEKIGYKPQSEREYGVIAQEILDVVPEVVVESGYGEDHLAVRYDKLVPLLIQAIKDQQAQIDELKAILLSR